MRTICEIPKQGITEAPAVGTAGRAHRRGNGTFKITAGACCALAMLTLSSCWRPKPTAEEASATPAPADATPAPATVAAPAPKPSIVLRLHGSSALGEKLLPELAQAYLTQKGGSNVRQIPGSNADETNVQGDFAGETSPRAIEIFSHGSGTAFMDLKAEICDIGMSARKATAAEAADLKAQIDDLTSKDSEHVLGVDGIAVIVNKDNPVKALSLEQLAGIFGGDVTDWAKVGGTAGPIHVFAGDEHSSAWDFFKEAVLQKYGKTLAAGASRTAEGSKLASSVAGDAGGIGFVELPDVGTNQALSLKDKGNEARKLSPENVAREDYLLSRRLYLYTPKTPKNSEVAPFLEFALGSAAHPVLDRLGLVAYDPAKPKPKDAPTPASSEVHERVTGGYDPRDPRSAEYERQKRTERASAAMMVPH